MARVSHCLMLVAAAALLAQPAAAQADSVRSRHAVYRHYHYAAYAYPYRSVGVILTEVATSPVYGTFGGYEDTFWASHYPGPVERRYFGYGWDPRLRF
jgi:hypothetical protein